MAIKNCLGLGAEELKTLLKKEADKKILEAILDEVTKADCSKSCDDNSTKNFNELVLFVLKKEFDLIDKADKSNGKYDTGNIFTSLLRNLTNNRNEFNAITNLGGGKQLTDLANTHLTSKYPNPSTTTARDKLLELAKVNNTNPRLVITNLDSDSYAKSLNSGNTTSSSIGGSNGSSNNSGNLIDSGLISDDRDFTKIPNNSISNLDINESKFKCFDRVFKVKNYLINADRVVLTDAKIAKLKSLHESILIPIYNYYYKDTDVRYCRLQVYVGITNISGAYIYPRGNYTSRHILGEAVDFKLTGIEDNTIIKDIKEGNIPIKFGVLSKNDIGCHITLPYKFNDYDVEGLIISSPRASVDSIELTFV